MPDSDIKVFLAPGATDMRKSINGLSLIVQEAFGLNPLSGHLFVFCNRQKNIVKVLYWDRNGFCLWHKRLEKDRFRWPESSANVVSLTHRELMWLIDGMEIIQPKAHKKLSYKMVG